MSIEHLHYITDEILTASQFIALPNCDFYKRSVSRTIALRISDFIEIGFKTNKSSINSRPIKDELNALNELYQSYFKLQRDKYGAHFQKLDLKLRIETWSNINLTKAIFFSTQAHDIYNLFLQVPSYIPLTTSPISQDNSTQIELVNDKYDIEKYPNASSDILALTRTNSGGIIHSSGIQTKAGVLKSLELLIDYELEILDATSHNTKLKQLFSKLFIIDLVSYADNFYTRTDISFESEQYEPGLDFYSNSLDFPEVHQIIIAFKNNYQFDTRLGELRTIRNKIAGHTDISLAVSQLKAMIDEFEFSKFRALYNQLKDTFKKICKVDMVFSFFALGPSDRFHGVTKMVSLPIEPFHGGAQRETIIDCLDINSEIEYENQLIAWIANRNEEARSFFWDCCCNSKIIDRQSEEVELIDNQFTWVNFDLRNIHLFFERKLTDSHLDSSIKLNIIDLFLTLRNGYPEALAYILIKAFTKNELLKKACIIGLGYLLSKPLKVVFQWIENLYHTGNFYEQYESLIALFRIDLRNRFSGNGNHLTGETYFSTYIKKALNEPMLAWVRFTFGLGLAGEYIYGNHHTGKSFNNFYYDVFENLVLSSLNRLIQPHIKNDKDKRALRSIRVAVHHKRYAQVLATAADFLIKHKQVKTGKNLFFILQGKLISFAHNDPIELDHYALACYKGGDLETAIKIAQYQVKEYAYKHDNYYFLLTLYLQDKQYQADFERQKAYVLGNFKLTLKEEEKFKKLFYNT